MARINPADWISRLLGLQGESRTRRAERTDKPAAQDQVVLSARAQEALRLRQLLGQVPEVREEKVRAIQVALDTGTYNPDPRAVADKLLEKKVVE